MLDGKKTYITAIGGILIAVGSFLTGEMTFNEALTLGIPSAAFLFSRMGSKRDAVKAARGEKL